MKLANLCHLAILITSIAVSGYAQASEASKYDPQAAQTKTKAPDPNRINELPAVIKTGERLTACPPGASLALRQLKASTEGSFKGSAGKIYEQACRNKDGNFNGPVKRWFANGQLFTAHMYRNGIATGEWKSYYPNGNLSNKTDFVEREDTNPDTANIPKVSIKSWYRSGKPACEYYGLYKVEEQKQGSKVWDEAGQEIPAQKYFFICGGDADTLLAKVCPTLKNCK